MKPSSITSLIITALLLGYSAIAHATPVTISGSMEGNLPISPGDTVKAGIDFTMPGNHAAATAISLVLSRSSIPAPAAPPAVS